MRIKLTLDRYEGDFGVCFDKDGRKHDIPENVLIGLSDGDIFTVLFDGKEYSSVIFLQEETFEKKSSLNTRLHKLFERSSK